MSQYIKYPLSGGAGTSIPTYATAALLPGSSTNGNLAITLDTDTLYIYSSVGSSWSVVGPAVQSVGLSLPASVFTVTGSPVTSSGTLSAALNSQLQNLVFASPSGATGVPSFRSLLSADIPSLDMSKITTGILATSQGGTGQNSTATFPTSGIVSTVPTSGVVTSNGSVLSSQSFLNISQGGTNSNAALNNNRVMISSGGAILENSALSPNIVLTTNASGLPSSSTVSTTTLGYLDATSSIQTQFNNIGTALSGKQASGNYITALTGDVVASGPGSVSATIQPNSVSNSKLAQMPTLTLKGNNTAGTANAIDLTVAQVNAMLGGSSGITTIGAIDTQTASANGLVISGSSLYAQSASATNPGLINTTTQTIAGNKTLSGTTNLSGLTASLPLQLDASKNIISSAINLSGTQVTGALAVTSGGTGQSAVGNDGTYLKSIGNTTLWSNLRAPFNNAIGNAFAEVNLTGSNLYSDTQTVSVSSASPAVATLTSTTGFYVGMPFCFTGSGTPATGTSLNTFYYITTIINSTTFNFSASLGGSNVNTTGASSGSILFSPAVPVTGAGSGSITLTQTRNTITPMRGSASFLITQPNTTITQGQGVSFPFTLDRSDRGRALSITFDYGADSNFTASSGQIGSIGSTNVDSDLEVWVYDITNSVLIPVSPRVITSKSNNTFFSFKGTFQASSSASYRLIFHSTLPTNNASGFNFGYSNLYIGQQPVIQGTQVSDWSTNNNFSFSASLGTTSSPQIRTKRVGDTLYICGEVTLGTVGATNASIGLPPGMSIDSSKLQSTGSFLKGKAACLSTTSTQLNTANLLSYPFFDGSDVNNIYFTASTASSAFFKAGGSNIAVSSQPFVFELEVPIVGWSSGVLTSADTDSRVCVASVYNNTGTISVTSGTALTMTGVNFDSHGGWNGTNTYTVPISGYYLAYFNGLNPSVSSASMLLYKNGSFYQNMANSGTSSTVGNGSVPMFCAVGDKLTAVPNFTGSIFTSAGNFVPTFSIQRIQGPNTVLPSEAVYASYVATGGISASTSTPYNFSIKIVDSHLAVTTGSSWRFTCPSSGTYEIEAYAQSTVATANNFLYKNGSLLTNAQLADFLTTGVTGGSLIIPLISGDYFEIRPGASVTLQNNTTGGAKINIKRIGN